MKHPRFAASDSMLQLFGRVLLLAVPCLFFSCTSARFNTTRFETAYKNKNYELCLKMLKRKKYGKKNHVLKAVDIGTVAHYGKDYKTSTKYFTTGEQLMDAGDLRSIAQFESFYLNILNCLNYYHLGLIEDAAAEIKKADDIKVRRGRENSNPLWFIKDESSKVDYLRSVDSDEINTPEFHNACETFGINPAEITEGAPRSPTEADLYQGSPTAYYLGTLMRKANGDFEGARLSKDYLKVLNPHVDLAPHLAESEDTASVNVLAFSGNIAQKKEEIEYFPPEENGSPRFLFGVSIPVNGIPFTLPPLRFKFAYTKTENNTTCIDTIVTHITNIKTGETESYPLILLEDFGEHVKKNTALTAKKEFERKAAASVVGKLTAAVSSATAIFSARAALAQTGSGWLRAAAELLLDAAEVSLIAALDASDAAIKADTRQARFLPAKASIAHIQLKPDIYTITVQYLNRGTVVYEEHFPEVAVSTDHLNLLESVCLK